MKRLFRIFIRITIVLLLLICQFASTGQSGGNRIVDNALKRFSEDAVLKPASWGFSVYRLKDSRQIISVNEHTALIPASVMKIISTSAALIMLGEEFRFETHIMINGTIDDKGVLQGDLIIKGYGDPTLGSDRWPQTRPEVVFSAWNTALHAAGIRGINGNIIGDGTAWDLNFAAGTWQYEDMGNYYGTGAGGLNICENTLRVFFQPAPNQGEPASLLRTDPPAGENDFMNLVTTGPRGSGDKVVAFGSPYGTPRLLTGTVPGGQKEFVIKASMPDPAAACAFIFKDWLISKNFKVSGKSISLIPGQTALQDTAVKTILVHSSPPLHSIIQQTNYFSINIFAEAMLKAVTYKVNQGSAYFLASSTMIQLLKNRGLLAEGLNISDGSGLSRTNLVTTDQVCRLLNYMAGQKHFYESLPSAGVNGTVRNFLRNAPPGITYRVKSGYISKVRAYSGYIADAEGVKLSFTIIINNFNCPPGVMRTKIEKLLLTLPELI